MYSVRAVAFSASGFQGNVYETSVRLETGDPQPPGPIVSSVSTTSVLLTWAASPSNDVVRYELHRTSLDADGNELDDDVTLSSDPAVPPLFTDLAYSDLGLTTGTTYRYRLWAVDVIGNVSTVREHDATPREVVEPVPEPPLNLSATSTGATVQLKWEASLSLGVSGYRVYLGGVLRETLPHTSTVANYSLDYDTSYTFSVTAVSAGGESAPATVTIQTGPQVEYGLQITNNSSSPAKTALYITLDIYHPDTQTWTEVETRSNVAANGSASFSGLPAGKYRYSWLLDKNKASEESREVILSGVQQTFVTTLY
jgi:hypothetical protein